MCVSLLFRFTNSFSCCHHQTTHFLQSVIDFTPPNWSKTTKLKVDPLRMLEKIYMSVKKYRNIASIIKLLFFHHSNVRKEAVAQFLADSGVSGYMKKHVPIIPRN